jgi:outer membrane protein OmpA-like peptidoglycan-associated protein
MMRARGVSFVFLAPLFSIALSSNAFAQTTVPPVTNGYAANQFEPSEAGSEWFANESLDLRGKFRPAIGVLADYSTNQIKFMNPDNTSNGSVVANLFYVHVGASLTILDRLRLGVNLPVALYQQGSQVAYVNSAGFATATYAPPGQAAIGDLRLGLDLRLLGEYGDPATLAIGGQVHLPTGSTTQYTGDGQANVTPHLLLAGDIWDLTYAARLGFEFRGRNDVYAGTQLGNMVTIGAAVGMRLADKRLVIGPEFFTETLATNPFHLVSSPTEALFGAHYRVDDWRFGLAAGGGIGEGYSSPSARFLASLEWTPAIEEKPADRDGDGILDKDDACPDVPGIKTDDPKTNGCPAVPVPTPSDRDGDGILDKDDACPDVPGVRSDDPKKNGCPADRDGDGIADKDDACPDVPGVASDDPKKNGCPADRDGDGIADKDDACPDVPGVKSDDPKKNGCPADRDGDGIADKDDACPDVPGIHSEDPKKNGCPAKAAIANGQIKITEQVQFKTGSATILPASDALLNDILGILKEHPEITKVHIEGHTDNKGSAAGNKTLSDKRARSVMAWLALKGIDKSRMDAKGFGTERPIESNDTDAGRQANRRVEFHIEQSSAPAP